VEGDERMTVGGLGPCRGTRPVDVGEGGVGEPPGGRRWGGRQRQGLLAARAPRGRGGEASWRAVGGRDGGWRRGQLAS
jgi:hypothetical protein